MIVEVGEFDYTVNQDNVLGQGLLFLKHLNRRQGQTGQVHTTDRKPAGC